MSFDENGIPEETVHTADASEELSPNYEAGGNTTYRGEDVSPVQNKAPKRKGWKAVKVIALLLAASIFGCAAGFLGGSVGTLLLMGCQQVVGSTTTTTVHVGNREPNKMEIENVNTGELMTPAQVYAANVNASVGISTSITTTNFWGYPTTAAVSGSGFILTSDGYIATNYHVVENGSDIKVTLFDGNEYKAQLMGYNEYKDIAILKINATGLPYVVLGDSDQLQVGEQVMTIGNPLGELTFSMFVGVLSAKDREVQFAEGKQENLLQTDCAINPGNSGGAMFNAYGEVVGIATGKFSGPTGGGSYIDNIGFAVPINEIKGMLQNVIEKGYTSRAYLGIVFTSVDERMQYYGIPKGASVNSVDAGSPAEKGGLKPYDVITVFNGKNVENKEDLLEAIDACAPNQKVRITISRSGEKLELEITLGEKVIASEY